KIDKLPPKKHEALRVGIVAFELDIERIELKGKLSQKDKPADRDGVIHALSTGDEAQRRLAVAMRDATR
ncbi:MAG: hypothetical protein KDE05_07125, partial [Parvularculaceae bacterium]|nr:hypothetical protein [Parvularculaceae bacterium]